MTTIQITPTEAIDAVKAELTGLPACIAGSAVAAQVYGLDFNTASDVDVFCYSEQALISGVQRMLGAGFTLNDRFARAWHRWLKWGTHGWHTNSMKLHGPNDLEVNLVYKLTGRHPVRSLAEVIESFDFGLLAVGFDLEEMQQQDMRSYLYPDFDLNGPLPLMPKKRKDWRAGFISQYNGTRQVGRYGKYALYGHDLAFVKDDLVTGYWAAALNLRDRGDADKLLLAQIYEAIAAKIENDDYAECAEAGCQILQLDALDQIMEALE